MKPKMKSRLIGIIVISLATIIFCGSAWSENILDSVDVSAISDESIMIDDDAFMFEEETEWIDKSDEVLFTDAIGDIDEGLLVDTPVLEEIDEDSAESVFAIDEDELSYSTETIASGDGWSLNTDGRLVITGYRSDGVFYDGNLYQLENDGLRDSVKEVVINEGITAWRSSFFNSYNNIEKVTLPASLIDITVSFLPCENGHLSEILVDANNPALCIEDGVLLNKSKTELIRVPCQRKGHYSIPDGVVKVRDGAFSGCKEITSLYYPKTLEEAGYEPLLSFTSLESIDVDPENKHFYTMDGLLYGKNNIFWACPAQKTGTVIIPENITWLHEHGFANCVNLDKIIVMGRDASAGMFAFEKCSKNTVVYGYRGHGVDGEAEYAGLHFIDLDSAGAGPEYEGQFYFADGGFAKLIGGSRAYPLKYNYKYSDEWFAGNNNYNHDLAKMSLRAAFAAFNADTLEAKGDGAFYIKALMDKLGYVYDESSVHYPYPNRYTIGYAIGSKNIDANTSVIMVAVRGAGYLHEWSSNVTVGESGDHLGFDEASVQVGDSINEYIKIHRGILKDRIKIWICGYSRAAATANLTAADLINGFIPEISASDIYAYCFECPKGTVDPNAASATYKNIHNIVNPIDMVPHVAMSRWGFNRYGTTYHTPFNGGNSSYHDLKADMRSNYDNLLKENGVSDASKRLNLVMEFTNEDPRQAAFCSNLAFALTEVGGSRSNYSKSLQLALISIIDNVLGSEKGEVEEYSIIGELIKGAFSNVRLTGNLKEVVDVCSKSFTAHYPELCLAWMDSVDGLYTDHNGKFIKVFINCPVNIEVVDANGNVAGQIIDDKVNYTEETVPLWIDTDGQKVVMLPCSSNYRINVNATDNGNVSYTVQEMSYESGSAERIVCYNNISMKKGETLTGSFISEEGVETDCSLSKYGEIIPADIDLAGNNVRRYSVTASSKGNGDTEGGGTYYTGEFAKVSAVPAEGSILIGWFVNGQLVSQDLEYRFCVTADTNVVAEFSSPQQQPTAQSEKITIKKKPTLKAPSATRNKIIVKWTHFKHSAKSAKKIWNKIKKVQIQCATDKKFKEVVKTSTVSRNKTKATIKGLKKNTTYYVRIRYTDGTGYSKWSKVKKVKTKKK